MSFVHKKEQNKTMKALIKEETEDLEHDIDLEIIENSNKLNFTYIQPKSIVKALCVKQGSPENLA